MPRLVGKQSNEGAAIGSVLVLAAIMFGALEYVGAIDLIPKFGMDGQTLVNPNSQPSRLDKTVEPDLKQQTVPPVQQP